MRDRVRSVYLHSDLLGEPASDHHRVGGRSLCHALRQSDSRDVKNFQTRHEANRVNVVDCDVQNDPRTGRGVQPPAAESFWQEHGMGDANSQKPPDSSVGHCLSQAPDGWAASQVMVGAQDNSGLSGSYHCVLRLIHGERQWFLAKNVTARCDRSAQLGSVQLVGGRDVDRVHFRSQSVPERGRRLFDTVRPSIFRRPGRVGAHDDNRLLSKSAHRRDHSRGRNVTCADDRPTKRFWH